MRIQRMREGVHERFEHVVALELVHPLEEPGVTLLQNLPGIFPGLVRQGQIDDVVLHPLPPERVEFGRRLRPRRVAPVELVLLVHCEVRLFVELLQCELESLPDTRPVNSEHVEYRVERLAADDVIELCPVLVEVVDVARQQIHPVVIQRIDVTVQDLRRQRVVHRYMQVVRLLYELGHEFGDLLVSGLRHQAIVAGDGRARGGGRSRQQCQQQASQDSGTTDRRCFQITLQIAYGSDTEAIGLG